MRKLLKIAAFILGIGVSFVSIGNMTNTSVHASQMIPAVTCPLPAPVYLTSDTKSNVSVPTQYGDTLSVTVGTTLYGIYSNNGESGSHFCQAMYTETVATVVSCNHNSLGCYVNPGTASTYLAYKAPNGTRYTSPTTSNSVNFGTVQYSQRSVVVDSAHYSAICGAAGGSFSGNGTTIHVGTAEICP